jgi:hypothetical protein
MLATFFLIVPSITVILREIASAMSVDGLTAKDIGSSALIDILSTKVLLLPSITDRKSEPVYVTYAVLIAGLTATANGSLSTGILVTISEPFNTDTVLEAVFAT